MASHVVLTNTATPPGPLVIHLPHDPYCVAVGACSCLRVPSAATRIDKISGKRSVVGGLQQVPATITLLAKASTKPLPAAILLCPDVLELMAAKKLKSVLVTPSAPTGPPPEPAPSPLPAPKPTRKAAPSVGGDS